MLEVVLPRRTRHGVYTLGDSVTCPSEARLHALDLVLEKLARECPDPTLLGRVVAISGAGQVRPSSLSSPSEPPRLSSAGADLRRPP